LKKRTKKLLSTRWDFTVAPGAMDEVFLFLFLQKKKNPSS